MPTRPSRVEPRLSTFNTLAARYQDEAYTLAFYLTGDDQCAAQATQSAFSDLYQRASLRLDDFRLEALRRVFAACRNQKPARARIPAKDDLSRKLLALKENERWAVVLIDVVGLRYEEAARVIGCSTRQINQWLAQGRLEMASQPVPAA